ncbi:Glutathione import ATP-binding protein GsiA [Achromobacter veterisilvae]|uniref:Glutathione import ATP-binding protein GsiA n=1 Tax=Achromobacter veterisilvae TaxID=2069367 RepID=A0A446CI77_9BURK|nr:ABC transporter ATP-binding protein [Achromobacter veterisilvae]SSW67572.1 Glutathione import ATP-binding protein GsiA [Achromobacter veterisilvae]
MNSTSPPGPAETTLSVRHLQVAFGTPDQPRTVIHDLSFDVARGEMLAIVGESGSGKSVTALSIMRLLPERNARVRGEILLDGRDLLKLGDTEMDAVRGAAVSMIFQEPMTSLNPVLTVGYQIGEALRRHRGFDRRAARAEAARLLERVHVPQARARIDDFPHQFSGGMRQRVMIAMALACSPSILIADEPTTALDVTIQAQILDLIAELQREERMAVLFITHDMGVVAEVADRALVMREGRCVEHGATDDLFAQPVHPYTRALLAAVPRLGAMNGKPRPEPFSLVDVDTGEFRPAPALRDTLDPSAAPVLEVSGLSTRFDVRGGLFGRVTARVHAVENVSLSIQPGETLALVGESGSGKSTIGRSVVGLNQPQEGSIKLEGRELLGMPARQLRDARRRIQIIFQDPFASLDPRQTVGAAIAEPLLAHGLADPRSVHEHVAAALAKVQLQPDMARRFPHEFSGGQRQRICLARILGLQPRLIIADESVSALDVSVKARIINLMLELQADLGMSYLFISHDLAAVERVSHRIAVMYLGEIVEIGPREAVLNNPQHPYTRQLLEAVPIPDPTRRRNRAGLAGWQRERSQTHAPTATLPQRVYRDVADAHRVMVWE